MRDDRPVTLQEREGVRLLKDYQLTRLIGSGCYGLVMLVQKKSTQRYYAMKILTKSALQKANQLKQARTERKILEMVNHPFITTIYSAFQTPNKLYFLVEYYAGGELFYHLTRAGTFTLNKACFYACEILLALEYLHSLHIIYRDLKPENLMLDAQGHIRLADFGLSCINASHQRHLTVCGTAEYLAPEMLLGLGYGKDADWYAFGCLIFEMLTGLPPFYSEDRRQLYYIVLNHPLKVPDSLSLCSQSLLKGLLQRDPESRLGSRRDGSEIREHPFFEGQDFDRIYMKEGVVPFSPKIRSSSDTPYVDSEFLERAPLNSDSEDIVDTDLSSVIEGFNFESPQAVNADRLVCC